MTFGLPAQKGRICPKVGIEDSQHWGDAENVRRDGAHVGVRAEILAFDKSNIVCLAASGHVTAALLDG